MASKWPSAKPEWFVMNKHDPYDLRKPGKFKSEWRTTTGGIIMLVSYHSANFVIFIFKTFTEDVLC